MTAVVEPLPNCLATIRVEVEPEKVAAVKEKVARNFGQFAKIPGFRPGKAPRAVIEKKFKKQIQEELEKNLLGESTREAIAQNKLRVLQVANIDDVQFGADDRLSFTATVVTQPDFVLPQYKAIPVKVASIEVTEAEVDASIENLREQSADFIDITEDRGAQFEDYLVIDYTGLIEGRPVHEVFPKAGKPLSGNEDFWIKMTEEAFFPGYCAALVGAKPGEKRSFEIEVPADFPIEGMPGQKIQYEVTVKAIKQKTLPALDDAFAATIATGKSLAELRQMAREEIEQQKKVQAEEAKRNQIMKHLLSGMECELPANLVRAQTQRLLSEIVRENKARGVAEETLKESEKEIVGVASQNARETLKGVFVLLRIAEQESITVTQDEVYGRIASLAQKHEVQFEKMLKDLQARGAIDQIQEEIVTGKALTFLAANALVTVE